LEQTKVDRVGGVVAQEKAFKLDSIIALVRSVRSSTSIFAEQRTAYLRDFNQRADGLIFRSQDAVQQPLIRLLINSIRTMLMKLNSSSRSSHFGKAH
jgi:hypothetical protein